MGLPPGVDMPPAQREHLVVLLRLVLSRVSWAGLTFSRSVVCYEGVFGLYGVMFARFNLRRGHERSFELGRISWVRLSSSTCDMACSFEGCDW